MFLLVKQKVIDSIAVPTQWPEWFDSGWQDRGELLTESWQDAKTTPAMVAKGKAWLDRSDPVAAALISADVVACEARVGQRLTHREYLAHCAATGRAPRPIGAYEPGGYLGRSEINTKSKRKVYTEAEKAQFLADAKRTGESIRGMKLSDAAKATLGSDP